jgi:hypothetical protein
MEGKKMKIVVELKGGLIQNILTDEPAEVLVLDHDAPLPDIDDEPEETVIDYQGDEIVYDEIKPSIEPLRVNYFFAMHEAQDVNLDYV